MLITEGQKQKYILQQSLIGRFERLSHYHDVTNTRPKTGPYILKDYFGSKNGLLGQTAKIHSGLAKIYKKSLKLRKNCISPKYLTTRYIEELTKNHMISMNDQTMFIGFQTQIQELYKKMKKLSNTIYTKYLSKKSAEAAGIVLVASGSLLIMGGLTTFFGGFVFMFPAMMISDFAITVAILVTVAGGISAFAGTGPILVIGSIMDYLDYKAKKEKNADAKNAIKLKEEVLADLKKCQSGKQFPGLPPRLIFTKDENGNIGIPISNYLVAYEPQNEIKEFYLEYKKFTKNFKKYCQTHDIGLFFNEGLKWEDLRPLWKASRNYKNFVEEMKKEGTELSQKLLKSHKGVGPGKNPKIKWSTSDELAYLHAEWLSELEYKGLDPNEIKKNLKAQAQVQVQDARGRQKADVVREFVENVANLPDIQIKATKAEGVTIDPSDPKKAKRKTISVITPTDFEGIDFEKSLKNPIEEIKKAEISDPDDFTNLPSLA